MDINTAWKNTCRLLLGGEIGELQDFDSYLSKYTEPIYKKKSSISGKQVIISTSSFSSNAKFISSSEIRLIKDMELSINEIKDIDSLLETIKERIYYSGNIIVGNSSEIYDSTGCADSSFVYKSAEIYNSKYIAFSSFRRFDEYVFGSTLGGESKFLISCFGNYKNTRCMGTLRTFTSSDCFYTANLEQCTNCIFSFNQKNKRNLIGNLELSFDEYSKIKNRLIGEMREMLKEKKSLPTIIDIMGERHE